MDDMKDKFKGFMKKVNTGLSSSSSGKFKGQGRVLGSSSSSSSAGPANPTLTRPSASSLFVNPNRNPNVNPKPNPSSVSPNSKPSSQKISGRSSFEDKKGPNADRKPIPNRPSSDGFDPFDSLVTTGKRNKNGYSLNVFECPVCNCGFGSEEEVAVHIESCIANPRQSGGDSVVDLAVKDGSEDKDESMNELATCVGKYLSGNPSEGSVEIVLRLLRNIVKEPDNPKFRRIRMGNPKIMEAIGEVPGGIELLEGVGFELKEEEGEMWALMDVPSEERTGMLKDSIRLFEGTKNVQSASAIASAKEDVKGELEKVKKSEPEVVDRQVKVFFSVPESVAKKPSKTPTKTKPLSQLQNPEPHNPNIKMSSFNNSTPNFDNLLLQSLMSRLQIRPPPPSNHRRDHPLLSQSFEDLLLHAATNNFHFSDSDEDSDGDGGFHDGGKSQLAKEEAKLEKQLIKIILSGNTETLKPNSGQAILVGEHHICVGFHEESGSDYRVWEWHGHIMLFDEENGYTPEYIYGNYFERLVGKGGVSGVKKKEDPVEEEESVEKNESLGLRELIESGDSTGSRILHRSINAGEPRI